MNDWFNYYGLVILIIIMIPNIVFMIKNKKESFKNKLNNKILEVFEQIGRYSTFAFMIINIPYTYKGFYFVNSEVIYIIVNAVLVFAYLLGWIIFWGTSSLTRSLILSIVPSLIFIFSGIITLNIPLIVSSLIFAPCHIIISIKKI